MRVSNEQLAEIVRRNDDRAAGMPRGCSQWTTADPSRGLGDTVAKITSALSIRPCGGCKERQATLNRWFPYRKE